MKRLAILLTAVLALCACCNKPSPGDGGGDGTETPVEVTVPAFARGADVSWVSEMENSGRSFRRADGSSADIFEVLKDCGINSVRLRVWVNPAGGWSGKTDVTGLAVRAAKAGMALMIDFHYSDFFADPGRQDFPKDWAADKSDTDKTAERVRAHTSDVLQALKDAGVSPAWIQIGNETRNGFLWPLGQLWNNSGNIDGGWARFVQLYGAGYAAAKAVFPQAVVMPHIDNAYDDNAWWFKEFKARGARFDAIALSHYPQTVTGKSPQQANELALSRIRSLASTYGVPVYVAEVGVKIASESASAEVLKAFVKGLGDINACKGVFYWEPEDYGGWKPAVYSSLGWNAYDMGAFLPDGRPSAIMDAFKQ